MTGSKMETKTFAELRLVALRPDRQEMNSLTERELAPRGGGDFLLSFTMELALSRFLWAARRFALLLHSETIPLLIPTPSPVCVALACHPHVCVGFQHMLVIPSATPNTYTHTHKWTRSFRKSKLV